MWVSVPGDGVLGNLTLEFSFWKRPVVVRLGGSAVDYQADEQACVARLSWRSYELRDDLRRHSNIETYVLRPLVEKFLKRQ